MTDLNIPNLNKKSNKYIFKKKLTLKRKSKRRLITESSFMFIVSLLLVYINSLIPNKSLLLRNLPITFNKSFIIINDLFFYLSEILIVVFIIVSSFITFILLVGSLNRLLKVVRRKKREKSY